MWSVSSGVRFFSGLLVLVGMVCGVSEVAVVGRNSRVVSRSRMIFDLVLWDILFFDLPLCFILFMIYYIYIYMFFVD